MPFPTIPLNEEQRLKMLQSLHLLDTLPEAEYDEITLLAAHICETPVAFFTLIDRDRQWYKSKAGMDITEMPRNIALCAHAISNPYQPMVVEDTRKDARFGDNPLVTGEANVRFYAGIPLVVEDCALGTLCVIDNKPRRLSEQQVQTLQILSQLIIRRLIDRKERFILENELKGLSIAVNEGLIVSAADKHGNIIYVNTKFEEVSGYAAGELIGCNHRVLNSGQHSKAFFRDMWQTISSGKTWRGEIKNRAKDGSFYWVDSVITPITDTEGKIEKYVSVRNLITDRKNDEDKVAASEKLLRNLTNQVPGAVFQFQKSADGYSFFPYVSDNISQLLPGVTAAKLMKNSSLLLSKIYKDDYAEVQKKIAEAILNCERLSADYRVVVKGGCLKWHRIEAKPQLQKDGAMVWHGIILDVTERRMTQKRIDDVTQQLKAVYHSSTNISLIATDLNGEITAFNIGAEKMLGYTEAEMLGKRPLLIHYMPEVKARKQELEELTGKKASYFDVFVHDARDGKRIDREWTYVKKDGTLVSVLVTISSIKSEQGEVIGFLGAAIDITERKSAERLLLKKVEEVTALQTQYSDILNSTSDLILSVDAEGHILFANNSWLKKIGHKNHIVFGSDVFKFIHPDDVKHSREVFEKVLQQEPLQCTEISFISADNKRIECEATITAKYDNGRLVNIRGFFRDVTELNKERRAKESALQEAMHTLENKVAERTADLEAANRELESFSYTVSHDLQGPIRNIKGFTKLLVQEYSANLNGEAREFLDIIDKVSAQMSEIVSDLLAFSKLGKASLNKKQTDMNELVGMVVDELNLNKPNPNAQIVIKPLPTVFCDPGLIKQVWVNLIGNALKYSAVKQNPVIEISSALIDNELVFTIHDNGAGFDMKYAGRLFEAFKRLHGSSEFEGTGVGLATVARIVEKHGGRVWANGEVNVGATFYFTLP